MTINNEKTLLVLDCEVHNMVRILKNNKSIGSNELTN